MLSVASILSAGSRLYLVSRRISRSCEISSLNQRQYDTEKTWSESVGEVAMRRSGVQVVSLSGISALK